MIAVDESADAVCDNVFNSSRSILTCSEALILYIYPMFNTIEDSIEFTRKKEF